MVPVTITPRARATRRPSRSCPAASAPHNGAATHQQPPASTGPSAGTLHGPAPARLGYNSGIPHGLSESHAPQNACHSPATGALVPHSATALDSLPGQSVRGYGAARPPMASLLLRRLVNVLRLP